MMEKIQWLAIAIGMDNYSYNSNVTNMLFKLFLQKNLGYVAMFYKSIFGLMVFLICDYVRIFPSETLTTIV